MWLRRALAALSLPALLLCAEPLPRIEGESLSGKSVTLPDSSAGRLAILIVGFTHESHVQCKVWDDLLESRLASRSDVALFPIAVFQDVPRLVRPVAARSIRGATPKAEWDRFLLLYNNKSELLSAVGLSAKLDGPGKDDAYLLVLDRSGAIRWKTHGPYSDSGVKQLEDLLRSLE